MRELVDQQETEARQLLARTRKHARELRETINTLLNAPAAEEILWRSHRRLGLLVEELGEQVRWMSDFIPTVAAQMEMERTQTVRLDPGRAKFIRKLNRRFLAALDHRMLAQFALREEAGRLQSEVESRLVKHGWEGEPWPITSDYRPYSEEEQSSIRDRIGEPSPEARAWAQQAAERLKLI